MTDEETKSPDPIQQLLNEVNDVLRRANSRVKAQSIRWFDHDVAIFETARGGRLAAPLCWFDGNKIGIRSLLKVRNKWERWTYLYNGQAGKNTEEIVFFGETDTPLLYPDRNYWFTVWRAYEDARARTG